MEIVKCYWELHAVQIREPRGLSITETYQTQRPEEKHASKPSRTNPLTSTPLFLRNICTPETWNRAPIVQIVQLGEKHRSLTTTHKAGPYPSWLKAHPLLTPIPLMSTLKPSPISLNHVIRNFSIYHHFQNFSRSIPKPRFHFWHWPLPASMR